ncbi:DNA topoisomerase 2-associated protein pat1 [Coemansia sp. RSA 1290]|nr:DNA topoisomerase 2-associated protein pat1 [Coemansia sp. RSA 1290]
MFFGEGIGSAADNGQIARERALFAAAGSDDMDKKLESLALEDNLGSQLDEDQDTFNAETFDADVGEIANNDFDFFTHTAVNQGKLQHPSTADQGTVPTAPRKVLTLAELEAQFMQQQRPAPLRGAEDGTSRLFRRADAETIARRREARLQREASLARYNNMMTRQDKERIVRIQISQLLTDDPAADDFYCHMFQLSRGTLIGAAAAQPQQQPQQQKELDKLAKEAREQRPRSNTQSSMARMQQHVQRIVNEARRRPKIAHVAAEGALGRISVNSARNPKQVIQVQQRSHAGSISGQDIRTNSPSTYDINGMFASDARSPAHERRATLRAIEAVYSAVLQLEQLLREQSRLPAGEHRAVQTWATSYAQAQEQAWAELGAAQPITNTYPHPLVRFLAFSKGKRLIPRLVHHLSLDQTLALTTTIIANFESLDVCRFGSFSMSSDVSARQRDETSLFLHAVMPPTLAFMAETPLQIINGLFALFMERNNVAWVARTRPAQVFMTVVLGRSAMLRQQQQQQQQQDLFQAAELYNHLFSVLRGSVPSLFPPLPALGQTPRPAEDVHAWQFLAALAQSASVEQQHILVADARSVVLERVQLAKSGQVPSDVAVAIIGNVNLFLNALGLDASQITG